MDVQAVLSLVAVSLIAAGSHSDTVQPSGSVNETSASTPPASTHSSCPCPVLASTPTASPPQPQLGLLRVKWTGQCNGDVNLFLYRNLLSLPVCYDSNVTGLLGTVCKERKGCKETPSWHQRGTKTQGYLVQKTGIEWKICVSLQVKCSGPAKAAEGDVQGQLVTYKVMTALLCCVLLLLLMIRFTKPTVRALQKRLSDSRQSRWIGPTQSHSGEDHTQTGRKKKRE
ncbi:unnamed protein product [Tetraodon nigroviridis]|uniref:(spotted green pufferfish) hypothetical protein n=1 Tax=Tetraodon nigroviridis TaxID=99883 RepID=Q4RKB5_TETNG|nr:unnamed protein product [Tetraodon nigroviridis]